MSSASITDTCPGTSESGVGVRVAVTVMRSWTVAAGCRPALVPAVAAGLVFAVGSAASASSPADGRAWVGAWGRTVRRRAATAMAAARRPEVRWLGIYLSSIWAATAHCRPSGSGYPRQIGVALPLRSAALSFQRHLRFPAREASRRLLRQFANNRWQNDSGPLWSGLSSGAPSSASNKSAGRTNHATGAADIEGEVLRTALLRAEGGWDSPPSNCGRGAPPCRGRSSR